MRRFRFTDFEVDEARFELTRGGLRVRIQPKPLQLLLHLLHRQPETVTKDELLDVLWPDETVTEFSLTRAVRAARQALGEDAGEEGVIRTVRGRGYRIGVSVEGDDHQADAETTAPEPLSGVRFFGREGPLAQFETSLRETLEGRGGVVFLVGEPGIGKTRTAEAFGAAASRAGAEVCWGRSYEGEDEPAYWPWMQILRACALARDAEALRGAMGVGAADIAALVPEVHALLPELPAPPELAPEQARFRMFDCVTTFLQRASKARPLVLVLDDLHWADEPSLRLAAFLARELGGSARVLVVGTYRNVGAPHCEALEEVVGELAGLTHTRPIALDGLSPAELEGFIADASQAEAERELVATIHAKTGGNPFFVREIVRLLEATQGDATEWSGESLERLAIPPSVRTVVERRVGRLSKESRGLLEAAAVIGEEAPLAVLAQAAGLAEEGLFEPLEEAEDAGLLRELPDRPGVFRFAHALVRETLYQALPRRRSALLHTKVGGVLERLHAAQLESHLAALAHHFGRAASAGDPEKAIDYASRAAQQAMMRLGFEQAASHAKRGIELAGTVPDPTRGRELELSLRSLLGVALITTKGYGASEVEENFARARELCGALGEAGQLFPILFGLYLFYLVRADARRAPEVATRVVHLARRAENPTFAIEGHNAAGITAFAEGDHARAREELAQSLALYDPQLHSANALLFGQDPAVFSQVFAGLATWFHGYPDQALGHAEAALALAERRDHSFSSAGAFVLGAALRWLRREVDAAHDLADAGVTISREKGFPLWLGAALMARGAALSQRGSAEASIADLEQGHSIGQTTGVRLFVPYSMCAMAEAYLGAGRTEEARATLDEALELTSSTLDRYFEPELHRVKGKLLLEISEEEPSAAEECFVRALELARAQGARSLELRAATSLARLWETQGRREEAHALLSPVYGWFTEGFGTRDLQEAKQLLGELAPDRESSAAGVPADLEPALESHAPQAERRHLTVMFCDLVGSMELSQQLDPEELRELVGRYQETCSRVIERYEGHIAQYLGDGLLVYFGYPQAHEDDAERAVRGALEIVHEIGNQPPPADGRPGLAVRIGIHTGMVVVGEMGSGRRRETLALGGAANVAARLQELAEPNSALISAAVRRLTQGYFFNDDLGAQTLKGITEPVEAYRVLRPTGVRSRLEAATASDLTPLVGREHELGLLMHRWEQLQDGHGQVVTLSGEAGIGKSRLVGAFRERLSDTAHTWLECRCTPYTRDSALAPVIELIQALLVFQPDDSPDEKLSRLEAALDRWEMRETTPLFASLLSLPLPERYAAPTGSPESQRRRTLEATVRWLFTVAQLQPLVLLGEDLHWSDPSTLELLGQMMEQVPTARLLVLLTHRPEFEAPWSGRGHATSVPLSRLTRRQAAAMVERIAGTPPLPEAVVREIVTKTDGIPLFVEELTKSVLESGVLTKGDGGYELTGPLAELAIPETLRDSLTARLDRLSPVKEVAQLCATLGREFSYELLQAVSPLEEGELQQGLSRLVEAELLYQRGLLPTASYVFKHALIQETAYQSLLKSRRQQFHQQIARALAERFPETAQTQPELVAHHASEAGLHELAIESWRRAGERAVHRWASVEAVRYLTRGLDLIAALEPTAERRQQEVGFRTLLGGALSATKGYGTEEVEQNFARARELSEGLGDSPHAFPALMGLWLSYLVRSDAKNAPEAAARLSDLARDSIESRNAAGITAWARGDFASARDRLAEAFAIYDPQRHAANAFLYGQDPGVAAQLFAGSASFYLGFPDRARELHETALRLAERRSHPFTSAMALSLAATTRHECGDAEATLSVADEAVGLSKEQGFPVWLGGAMVMRGAALSRLGDVEAALAELHEGLSITRAAGTRLFLPFILGALAETYVRAERPRDAREALDEALQAARTNLDCYYAAELHRMDGELRLASDGDPKAAEACFDRALERAREQSARILELRAAMSKARLWKSQGKSPAARELLAPIYGWFTEGFDTADLRDARALLHDLANATAG